MLPASNMYPRGSQNGTIRMIQKMVEAALALKALESLLLMSGVSVFAVMIGIGMVIFG